MFWHNLKYSWKTIFRSRALIFWTFAFPIIMATFFYMAFSGITESEKLNVIDVAMVDGEESQEAEYYREALAGLSDSEDAERLFNLRFGTEEEVENWLKGAEIDGYLKIADGKPKVVVETNGVNQTIFAYVVEEIEETGREVADLAGREIEAASAAGKKIDYEKVYEEAVAKATGAEANLVELETGKLDYVMVEYYTLIAMTCLYGGILGMAAINQKLANMSNVGKRVAVAPTRKSVVVISSALAGYLVQLIGLGLLFAYTVLVLKVDYGENAGLVVLLALVGSLAGLALGTFVTTVLKVNENAKVGIIIAVTMLGCFLSGMMGVQIKYFFDQNVPWLNAVNPASMITDGYYALYYYGELGRYWRDLLSLAIFSSGLLLVAALVLRRQKYDNL